MELGCQVIASPYGEMGLTWREVGSGPRVARIYLPNQWATLGASERAQASVGRLPAALEHLVSAMRRFLEGQAVELPVDLLALEDCTAFRRRVLLAEHAVPRGWVTTYGRLAAQVGVPGGARAAGGALAGNPFPIVIPCHRAIAADGGLGGYQGGLAMKRALLQAEGVAVSEGGRVQRPTWCY